MINENGMATGDGSGPSHGNKQMVPNMGSVQQEFI